MYGTTPRTGTWRRCWPSPFPASCTPRPATATSPARTRDDSFRRRIRGGDGGGRRRGAGGDPRAVAAQHPAVAVPGSLRRGGGAGGSRPCAARERPRGRGADLACGAALCNMRVAVAATGRQAVVEVLPDPHDPDVAGLVRIGGARTVTPEDHALAGAVARRTTNRRPFVDRPVPRRLSSALSAAAEVEGARLLVLSPAQLDVFAELLRRADQLLAEDAEYRRELADWTHDGGRADGVPASAGGPCPEAGALLALRDFRPDERARPAAAFEQDPLVAVLTTATDTRRHRVLAGVAMERVLLAATARGLSA